MWRIQITDFDCRRFRVAKLTIRPPLLNLGACGGSTVKFNDKECAERRSKFRKIKWRKFNEIAPDSGEIGSRK